MCEDCSSCGIPWLYSQGPHEQTHIAFVNYFVSITLHMYFLRESGHVSECDAQFLMCKLSGGGYVACAPIMGPWPII
jgi:hypothetical protein